jgi:polyketide biosynthesis acyl carrier protein
MTPQEVFSLIVRHTREVLPALATTAVSREHRLQDLGANSVDRAEIIALVMESLSLAIPRTQLFGPRNIGELADLVHSKLAAV